jgi:hypothetical protein
VTVRYGTFSNTELLSDYGFTVHGNVWDKVRVRGDEGLLNAARSAVASMFDACDVNA